MTKIKDNANAIGLMASQISSNSLSHSSNIKLSKPQRDMVRRMKKAGWSINRVTSGMKLEFVSAAVEIYNNYQPR